MKMFAESATRDKSYSTDLKRQKQRDIASILHILIHKLVILCAHERAHWSHNHGDRMPIKYVAVVACWRGGISRAWYNDYGMIRLLHHATWSMCVFSTGRTVARRPIHRNHSHVKLFTYVNTWMCWHLSLGNYYVATIRAMLANNPNNLCLICSDCFAVLCCVSVVVVAKHNHAST